MSVLTIRTTSETSDVGVGATLSAWTFPQSSAEWKERLDKRLAFSKAAGDGTRSVIPVATDDSARVALDDLPQLVRRASAGAEVGFRTLKRWEGIVDQIKDGGVHVRLFGGAADHEIAVISADDVDKEDIELLRPGAIFYWSIGYREKLSGRETVSVIRFRRMPIWTERQLKEISSEADDLFKRFGTD